MPHSKPALPTDLAQQRLLLVGGCGGIGRAVAHAAVQAGAKVTVLDLPASIARHPVPGVQLLPVDANDPTSVDQAVAQASAHMGGIDGCVNLVGFMSEQQPLADMPTAVWQEVMRGNLDAAFTSRAPCCPICVPARTAVWCTSRRAWGLGPGRCTGPTVRPKRACCC